MKRTHTIKGRKHYKYNSSITRAPGEAPIGAFHGEVAAGAGGREQQGEGRGEEQKREVRRDGVCE